MPMYLSHIEIRNFRRLVSVAIKLDERATVFVGPNNSGKTSATAIFRCFLGRSTFRIHDFSTSSLVGIDRFGELGEPNDLPAIHLDLWFKADPATLEFGRAFPLLPSLSADFKHLGLRLSYQTRDPSDLHKAFQTDLLSTQHRSKDRESPAKSLSGYLSQDEHLRQHFATNYASLERTDQGAMPRLLDPSEGKRLLGSLLQVDFIDAQRNIGDEEGHRATRLSNAFAGFYKRNLEQAEVAADAIQVIASTKESLTQHYNRQFEGLMKTIRGLGVPGINDRRLSIVSSLTPEAALQESTELFYTDPDRNHALPEAYNGLGFKNLIYMAIQARSFHSEWLRTSHNRPICQIIFVEEPEVHLHAQVQQTFIQNIWGVLKASESTTSTHEPMPQLVLTTHSSHILDATEFAQVRYFRRSATSGEQARQGSILDASEVQDLREFAEAPREATKTRAPPALRSLQFLKRYLRLSHCDLFFADAAVLVEGASEKLLLQAMIEKVAPQLKISYLSVLEVGGAYAHRFYDLLKFLSIPYLVITDLDSVHRDGRHRACRGDTSGAVTANASLKNLLGLHSVAELLALGPQEKQTEDRQGYITFQQKILIKNGNGTQEMIARTFEEAFLYHNPRLLLACLRKQNPAIREIDAACDAVYDYVTSGGFKKTDFAMKILARRTSQWQVPGYITEGLLWLANRLHGPSDETED
jgi:putative ATP-dependent endonuclease of the OLD family